MPCDRQITWRIGFNNNKIKSNNNAANNNSADENIYTRRSRLNQRSLLTAVNMASRPEGEMKIPAKLTASPLCAPARITGQRYAQPVPKRTVPPGREGNHYPLNHPLRVQAHEAATAQRAMRETERANAMNAMIETRMVRLRPVTGVSL